MFVGCFAIVVRIMIALANLIECIVCLQILWHFSPNIDVIKHVCGYENFLPSLNMFNTSFGNGKTFLL